MTIPQDALACLACGALQTETTWEYCEIRVEHGTLESDALDIVLGKPPYKDAIRFCADGAGPAGVYTLGQSEWVEGSKPIEGAHRDLFERVIEDLRLHGWQPLLREGGDWWAQRFRRAVNAGNRSDDPPTGGSQ